MIYFLIIENTHQCIDFVSDGEELLKITSLVSQPGKALVTVKVCSLFLSFMAVFPAIIFYT